MTTLLFCPQTRNLEPALRSIWAIEGDVDLLYMRQGDDPNAHRYANASAKVEQGRQIALAGGYDALMLVDDDNIIPPDAWHALNALDTDIAYGLNVWRNVPHHWSATLEVSGEYHLLCLNEVPDKARAAWGTVIPVAGVGGYCTLIRRRVLEAVTFQRRGMHAYDWYFSCDVQPMGFTQLMDMRVICGHMLDSQHALYPALYTPHWYEIRKV